MVSQIEQVEVASRSEWFCKPRDIEHSALENKEILVS